MVDEINFGTALLNPFLPHNDERLFDKIKAKKKKDKAFENASNCESKIEKQRKQFMTNVRSQDLEVSNA